LKAGTTVIVLVLPVLLHPAIISGEFSTFRHMQGRKMPQLVIEPPAEQAAPVFSTFGYPGPGNPIPVAVAKLVKPGGRD
jgi:hypothetical protein